MKRADILNGFPYDETTDEMEEYLKGIVDHFEAEFCEIKKLLDISSVSELGQIEEAKDKAKEIARDLY